MHRHFGLSPDKLSIISVDIVVFLQLGFHFAKLRILLEIRAINQRTDNHQRRETARIRNESRSPNVRHNRQPKQSRRSRRHQDQGQNQDRGNKKADPRLLGLGLLRSISGRLLRAVPFLPAILAQELSHNKKSTRKSPFRVLFRVLIL